MHNGERTARLLTTVVPPTSRKTGDSGTSMCAHVVVGLKGGARLKIAGSGRAGGSASWRAGESAETEVVFSKTKQLEQLRGLFLCAPARESREPVKISTSFFGVLFV